ncbi:MAG: hypothetical protein WDN76_10910 [Alphaproteobacteria bacterium]
MLGVRTAGTGDVRALRRRRDQRGDRRVRAEAHVTKGPQQPLLLELPTYKLPDPRDFFLNLLSRAWAFLKRAGTVIFTVSVILWFWSAFRPARATSKTPSPA